MDRALARRSCQDWRHGAGLQPFLNPADAVFLSPAALAIFAQRSMTVRDRRQYALRALN
jgi:hypothetical protein